MPPPALLVFSHLRWNFVFQRPQHVMSRLARDWTVYFIEEPETAIGEKGEAGWEFETDASGVVVCRPRTSAPGRGFDDPQHSEMRRLVERLIDERGLERYAVWTYTPMAWPIIRELAPEMLVYDSKDELSKFLHAPPALLENERSLLAACDVVFTGGPSLFRAKRDRHANVHCCPSSVDAEHFARAKRDEPEAEEQRTIPHPRLGYFGVIDERIDLPLLAQVADARPDWHLVMVGPVVKIDPDTLPRRPNIRYLGQQSYARLPDFLRCWDVCLLPFARNEATEFISPTKTLEYFAADRLVVGTPITDVAEPYGDIVYLAPDAESFVEKCRAALEASDAERRRVLTMSREVVRKTSWDRTVAGMNAEIEKVFGRLSVSET